MFKVSLARILEFSEKTFRCLFLSKAISFKPICRYDASSKRFFTRVAFVGVELLILPCIDSWTNEYSEWSKISNWGQKLLLNSSHIETYLPSYSYFLVQSSHPLQRRRILLVNSWQPMTEWNHCACGRFSKSRGLSASVSFLSSPPPPPPPSPSFTRSIFALQSFAPNLAETLATQAKPNKRNVMSGDQPRNKRKCMEKCVICAVEENLTRSLEILNMFRKKHC